MRVGQRKNGNRYPNLPKGFNTTSANDVRQMALRSPIAAPVPGTPTANKAVTFGCSSRMARLHHRGVVAPWREYREAGVYAAVVVDDSFTFGDQVSDDETWPACLEATLHRGVDNGGVFGYVAAQALRRALLKLNEKKYEHLVLSILVAFAAHPAI
jgi:hypothetical protein